MVVCGLNECEASARPQSFVVVEQIWRADPNSLSRDRPDRELCGRTFVRNSVAWQAQFRDSCFGPG